MLEKTLESPLDCKKILPVHSKGDQSWVFIGKTYAKAETQILWPPHVKSWLIGKDSDAGRDWGKKEKGIIEDEMAGWHHWLDGPESEWAPGVGDGQGGLACCDSWGRRVGHDWATELKLNWTDANGPCYLIIYLPRVLSRKYVEDWLMLAIGRAMGKSFLILKSIRPWEISVVDAQPQL